MEKLFQLHSVKEVKEFILVEIKEAKKEHKYTNLPNARDMATQIEYSCYYYLKEDFNDINPKDFSSQVGTYLFHKVFMDYCPYLYMKWYDKNSLEMDRQNPLCGVKDYQAAVKSLKTEYTKEFPSSADKMVFVDLKRTVLGNLTYQEEQFEDLLRMHLFILERRNLKEKKMEKELIEMLELLQGIEEQAKTLKYRYQKILFKN